MGFASLYPSYKTAFAFSRREAPEGMRSAMPSKDEEGAGKAGCPQHPRSCAQNAHG